MQAPAFPPDEAARLAELRASALLDTAAEERFDRVTRMARRVFGVPIALVSLVDENRQWFKSCIGLEATETSREVSFCGHAILGRDVFVIEDALADPRFADNPLVTGEPRIRFYAGYPLRTASGHALGTLCIIDQAPRSFAAEDRQMLSDLAQMVERELVAIQLAVVDELTRISNRRGFLAMARYSLDICRRQGFPARLVFFDLDKFKDINDTHGHAAGDTALKLFADQLRESFRSSDVFGRLGGDEFVALLTGPMATAQLDELMARFRMGLVERCSRQQTPYLVQFSYGSVAYDPLRHATPEDMLHEADDAMYAQKSARRRSSI